MLTFTPISSKSQELRKTSVLTELGRQQTKRRTAAFVFGAVHTVRTLDWARSRPAPAESRRLITPAGPGDEPASCRRCPTDEVDSTCKDPLAQLAQAAGPRGSSRSACRGLSRGASPPVD